MSFEHITADKSLFDGAKVAVVGDVMLDTFVYGDVTRISPEAPVPVVQVSHETNTLGGAGNVAANLVSLGATPLMIGRVGEDKAKKTLFELALTMGVDFGLMVTSQQPTSNKTRIVAANQQIVRIDNESTLNLEGDERKRVIEHLKQARAQTDVVVVADYDKGVIDQDMFETIKEIWKDGTVLVDPKVRAGIDYSGASMMTPNLDEARQLADAAHVAKTDKEAEEIAKALCEKFSMPSVLCTRAGDGMTLLNKDKFTHFKPFEKHEVRDVSGAGDTVISVVAAGVAAGLSMEDAVELANISGSIVVSKIGTATIYWSEIVDAMKRSNNYAPFVFR